MQFHHRFFPTFYITEEGKITTGKFEMDDIQLQFNKTFKVFLSSRNFSTISSTAQQHKYHLSKIYNHTRFTRELKISSSALLLRNLTVAFGKRSRKTLSVGKVIVTNYWKPEINVRHKKLASGILAPIIRFYRTHCIHTIIYTSK